MQTKGFGFAGVWSDGTLGWFMPDHISNGGRNYVGSPNERAQEFVNKDGGDRFFLCKITVTPVVNVKGRPITKIVKRKAGK